MLINKGYSSGDVVSFKLVNGDEIVAKIIEHNSSGDFTITKPCTIIPGPQGGLGMVQSMFSGDINNDVALKSEHVMLHSRTTAEIEKHYLKTTTGIQLI
jgi:hypothetical protein